MSPIPTESQDRPVIRRHSALAMIRTRLTKSHVLAVRLIGPPGSGKTQLIEKTLKCLPAPRRVAVIAVNPASGRDADRLRNLCGYVASIDAAIPHAGPIWDAIAQLNLNDFDLILIESAGGLAPLPDLGQDAGVAVFAVSGGDDKAVEYSMLLKQVSAVLLTKNDLKPHVRFDERIFVRDVATINPSVRLLEVSSVTPGGLESWVQWLKQKCEEKKSRTRATKGSETLNENFMG